MKRTICAVAAMLAIVLCLSQPGGALAAPTSTPTPTPTPRAEVATPTPSGDDQPDGPGGGGSGPGGGTRKPDGPGGTGKPEVTAPPTRDDAGDKDNTPIEVEVDPELDADIKLDKEKMKEYEKQAVWTISFKKATASSANKHAPQAFSENYVFDFTATKQGGEKMLGSYKGEGFLVLDVDTSGLIGMSEGALLQMDIGAEGPLSGIAFELVASYAENPQDRLAPLVTDESLAPLVPPDNPAPKLSGEANSTMAWASAISKNYIETVVDSGQMHDATPPQSLTYFIYAYPSGKAEINLYGTTAAAKYLVFWGDISKKISWKQVK